MRYHLRVLIPETPRLLRTPLAPRVRLMLRVFAFGITSLAFAARSTATPAAPVQILVDGQTLPATPERALTRIPASHKTVSFRLGHSPQVFPEKTRRIRFYLEGLDSGWRQIASEMCFIVRFVDANGDQVGQRIFPVDGTSPGWRGSLGNSTFGDRREAVQVPAGSAQVTLAISSSGPPTAMGLYAVRALRIISSAPDGSSARYEMEPGQSPNSQDAPPPGWGRSGTRPSMASIATISAGTTAFCVLDDDPNAHAEWVLSRGSAPRVQSGETLTITWSEMFDIGMGNRFDVNYGSLSAGTHIFWSEELDATGNSLGRPQQVHLLVSQPFWKSIWFWVGASLFAALLIWSVCRVIIRRRLRLHLARAEQEHLIERERLRIARDLHDDLGARLTHISLMSGLAEKDPHTPSSRESFQRISGMARELVAALSQTVWTVNPEHDHLEALVNYLCQLTQNISEPAHLRCRIHFCEVPGERRVTSETRHHVTLAVKEALHNAIKYSHATEIVLGIEFADPHLKISITDDGEGFDSATVVPGNGLANMRHRMSLLGGSVSIKSVAGEGATVRFVVPIPAA